MFSNERLSEVLEGDPAPGIHFHVSCFFKQMRFLAVRVEVHLGESRIENCYTQGGWIRYWVTDYYRRQSPGHTCRSPANRLLSNSGSPFCQTLCWDESFNLKSKHCWHIYYKCDSCTCRQWPVFPGACAATRIDCACPRWKTNMNDQKTSLKLLLWRNL